VRVAVLGVNSVSRHLVLSLLASGMDRVPVIDYRLLCNLRFFDDDGRLSTPEWPPPLPAPADYREWAAELDPEALDCLIATSDFGGLQLMRPWNEFCVQHRIRFFPVVLQDLIGYIGPLVVPGETACFECVRARQNAHFDDPKLARAPEGVAFEGQAVAGYHPAMAAALGSIAAFELGRFYGGGAPPPAPRARILPHPASPPHA